MRHQLQITKAEIARLLLLGESETPLKFLDCPKNTGHMTLTELRRFPETFADLLKGLQDELSVQLSDVRRVLLDADIEGSMMSLFNQREAGFAAGAQHDLFVAALSRGASLGNSPGAA